MRLPQPFSSTPNGMTTCRCGLAIRKSGLGRTITFHQKRQVAASLVPVGSAIQIPISLPG
ncbi:Uncharacterised protein [Vibrio cholerae]|nr:Uncharacterised protein [Vibrio cholerae]